MIGLEDCVVGSEISHPQDIVNDVCQHDLSLVVFGVIVIIAAFCSPVLLWRPGPPGTGKWDTRCVREDSGEHWWPHFCAQIPKPIVHISSECIIVGIARCFAVLVLGAVTAVLPTHQPVSNSGLYHFCHYVANGEGQSSAQTIWEIRFVTK